MSFSREELRREARAIDVLRIAEHRRRDGNRAHDADVGLTNLALDGDRTMQVEQVERLGVRLDLCFHDLALQRHLALDVEHRLLRVEQR